MIRDIACDISDKVLATGLIKKHFQYCEMIRRGDATFPGQYIGLGNYDQVFTFDLNGMSYLRKTGPVSTTTAPDMPKMTSCPDDVFVQA
jgi:hypothetical protein